MKSEIDIDHMLIQAVRHKENATTNSQQSYFDGVQKALEYVLEWNDEPVFPEEEK